MDERKILIADGLDQKGLAILRKTVQVDDRTGITPEELQQVIGEYQGVIVRSRTKITQQVFGAAKQLRVVGRAGVGVDNIDLESARSHNVTVVNAPEATSDAVAELTLGLMISMSRRLPFADSKMKQGEWVKKQLMGSELRGKTLGIIGMGRIGSAVARLAGAVGMHVIGYDPYLLPEEIQERGAVPSEFVQPIYDQADYITYHVPLTEETRGVVNEESFNRMKKGMRLICTARGGVINETDLLAALNNGIVAGAALDVFAKEPPGLTDLIAHPNVIATPHIGAQTVQAQERAAVDIANEVLAVLDGKALRWKIV